jgi:predicted Fe-S protein YdhL (DUF1289 family)
MDGDRRYCLGCWRTLEEITRWGSMSDDEQATVLALLKERRAMAVAVQNR